MLPGRPQTGPVDALQDVLLEVLDVSGQNPELLPLLVLLLKGLLCFAAEYIPATCSE